MTNTPGDHPTPPEPERPSSEQPTSWGTGGQPGQPPTSSYGAPPGQPPYQYGGPPGQPPYQYAPDHPRATTSLVLGILGVVLCQVVAPFAWAIGKRTLNEIDASQGTIGGRGAAQAGYILGIVGTVLLILAVVLVLVWVVVMIAIVGSAEVGDVGPVQY